MLLKKFLPKVISGPWGWIISFVGEKLFDKVLRPAWNFLMIKIYAFTNWMLRKKRVERFEKAKNETDFDDSFDDLP